MLRSVRALGALAVVGVGVIVATAATSLAAFLPDLPWAGRIGGAIVAILLNVVVLTTSYRVLVHADVGWRALTPGGIVGGIALWALQLVGATYVTQVIVGASDVYGTFATMFGLLVWIALLARVTLLASEVNVVRARRLWPRSLRATPPTDADRRALEATMRREVYQDPVAARTPRSGLHGSALSRTRLLAPQGDGLVDPDEQGATMRQGDHDDPLPAGERDGVEQPLQHVRARPRPR